MTLVHEHIFEFYRSSVNSCVFGMIHEKHMTWFHVFEGSLTSFFSKINLTSYLFFNVYEIYT